MRFAGAASVAFLCLWLMPTLPATGQTASEPLKDPPLLVNTSTTPGVFQAQLDIRMTACAISGRNATLMTYNGTFPGPTIRVKRGDVVKLRVVNSLPATSERNALGFVRNHTNLRVHGLNVSSESPADDARADIPPGASRDYEYDLCETNPGVTGFYHPGLHGLAAEQLWAGLVGAVIVDDELLCLARYESHILLIKDVSAGDPASERWTPAQYAGSREGETITVNGQVNPWLLFRPGQVQRWRILNGSNARFYKLALDGFDLNVIGTDGGLLDKPCPARSLLLAPGERLDVLVKASQKTDTFRLVALPYLRGDHVAGDGPAAKTILTVSNQGFDVGDPLPAALARPVRCAPPDTSRLARKTLILSLRDGRAQIQGTGAGAGPAMVRSDTGAGEVWEVFNDSASDCPFHLQTCGTQVLSIKGGDPEYVRLVTTPAALKDVVIVPRHGSVELLVPGGSWPGMAVFQSQIPEFADLGMTGVWHRTMPAAVRR